MRYLLLALMALSTSLAAQPWRVVGDEQFAPYSFVTAEDDTPRGLDVELVDAVLREAQVPHEIRLYPWERVKRMLDRGEVQMAFQFAGTPQRQQQYELVGPLRSGSTVFMTTAKTAISDWQTLDDLSPYVIGQVRGYAYEEDFDRADLARDTSAQNPRQLVSMLLAGRIDIIVGDHTQLLYFIREQRALEQVRVLPRPLIQMPRFVAFAKGDTERARQFSEALVRLRKAGKLDEIQQRWHQ
ncbi:MULTISPECIES: substrate-binding periplasmic protein [Pseudomonadaceae]|uniref:Transporter substrate-binding domain-containing protein n=1 Tax=Ectopseudomonas toyotomiensis TaxID=554344 RepID=A0AA42IRK7_9GAMM|nr:MULTISPECIES: transporter substrate-binding domain-containing protein [Pseudomonas]AQZ34784.1 amino acid ABC transporter substrate-binding protein [Pseudomonas sp. LPH1]MBG0839372.1 amino acid ABC transporter substrate-binding protein [Pseudomonas toyotomiensis]MDH0701931.1 transporter substrate-binding domain-containing protein [Pseudomonas toyotomiensis]